MYSLFAPLFPSRPRLRSLLLLTTLLASVSIGSDVKATQGRAPRHGVPLLQRAQIASVDTAVTSGTAVPSDSAGDTINAAANPAVVDRSALVFLPIIASGRIGSGSINKPLPPDAYDDDGADPPSVAEDPNATECASFIDFTNFSNETVYVFWVGPGDEEMLYKVLESGRHYWQHTYRYNEWRVRDDAGRLVLAFTQQDCEESAHNIFIDDLPPCGGILQIGLWDRVREVPLNGYAALTDGMTIDLGLLPPAIIHIDAQDAVESVEVLGGGAVVALNELPYNYPPNNAAWQPAAGELSLIFNAYRKDNAVGTICDSRELSLTILYSTATPSPTVTPTTDGGPTATVTPTPSATSDGSVTATPSATPSLTQTPATGTPVTSTPTPSTPTPSTTPESCGRIEAIRFYDLDADAPIARYAPLQNGAIVDLDKLPPRFNIDVLLSGAAESLRFALNGDQSLENRAPYRYPGADVNPWQPAVGGYTLVATAYEFDEAAGAVCDQQIINFAVVDGAATVTPTPSSTGTPTATPTPTPTTVVPATPTPTPTVTPTVTSTVTLTPTATPIPNGATCLGDRAWIDSNENGRQDAGEVGLGAIDIYLWADDNVDGLRDRIITATTTNSAGSYALCGLDPTLTYIVEFGTLPQCRFTLADQGTDEALDSDAIPVSGLTTPIQLATGENNVTVDAGFVCGEF